MPEPSTYRALTPEELKFRANEARKAGLDELADIFESLADKIAQINERSSITVEEARQLVGEKVFWDGFMEGVRSDPENHSRRT